MLAKPVFCAVGFSSCNYKGSQNLGCQHFLSFIIQHQQMFVLWFLIFHMWKLLQCPNIVWVGIVLDPVSVMAWLCSTVSWDQSAQMCGFHVWPADKGSTHRSWEKHACLILFTNKKLLTVRCRGLNFGPQILLCSLKVPLHWLLYLLCLAVRLGYEIFWVGCWRQ